jgi:transcriptional regulator with XRE-family HTH domain
MERGEKVPNAAMILRIANTFDVSIDLLMKDELELDE